MNFLSFEGMVGVGIESVELSGVDIKIPSLRQGAKGSLTLGIRPEHVNFSDTSKYRGCVLATDYRGTTQIITLATANGEIKARIPSNVSVAVGETIGLEFDGRTTNTVI
mmetsp:Transcript_11639/g.19361  ORF Transcript_11639/g.19361 Transcript_11639/m.19361 type:complete len:109 (-) Transcript_11639:613-939(-)